MHVFCGWVPQPTDPSFKHTFCKQSLLGQPQSGNRVPQAQESGSALCGQGHLGFVLPGTWSKGGSVPLALAPWAPHHEAECACEGLKQGPLQGQREGSPPGCEDSTECVRPCTGLALHRWAWTNPWGAPAPRQCPPLHLPCKMGNTVFSWQW